jgi:signal transduction histidine kinase
MTSTWDTLSIKLQALTEMSAAMNRAHSESDVYDIAARYAPRVLDIERASVTLLSEDRSAFDVIALRSDHASPIDVQVPAKGSFLSVVVDDLVPRSTEDITRAGDYHDWRSLAVAGQRAVMNAPLVAGDVAIGCINVSTSTVRGFDDKDLAILCQLASHVASNVQGLRLYSRARDALQQAQTARDQAQRASRAKSHFLANMSHELRTPLNAIIGYSEMLREDAEDEGAAQRTKDLRKVETAARHLLGLINDILDLSKIEAGKMRVVAERFAVASLVGDVASTVEALVRKNGNDFFAEVSDEVGDMVSDPAKVRQILVNLLGNAAKFTEQGRVRLDASLDATASPPCVVFAVTDTGIGMTEEQQQRVFRPFEQAKHDTARDYGGTGLGLTLTIRFCELLGGGVSVESAPGVGSTFRARLPLEVPVYGSSIEPD